MIQEFSITNHLSIRDKLTVSFEPRKQYRPETSDLLLIHPNKQTSLLKAAVFYGANASGKSNIIRSFEFIHEMLTDNQKNKSSGTGFIPFLFDEKSGNEPGEFELVFFVDGLKYVYSLVTDERYVLREKLLYYPARNPAKIFERSHGAHISIEFGKTIPVSKYEKEIIRGNCIANTSVIAVLDKVNVRSSILERVSTYFTESFLPIITPKRSLLEWTVDRLEAMSEQKRTLLLHMLNQADFNIKEVSVRSESGRVTERLLHSLRHRPVSRITSGELEVRDGGDTKTVEFLHAFSGAEKRLDISQESRGTRRYLELCSILAEMLSASCILAVDDLETSLHPDLLIHFLLTFLVNAESSQILFTTHNQSLLESDFLRRDMFWFVEKDRDHGHSMLGRGSDFGIHKNNSLASFYKIGKLGAVPDLGSVHLLDLFGDCSEQ